MSPIWMIVVLLLALALSVLVGGARGVRRRAYGRGGVALVTGTLLLALGLATGTAAWSLGHLTALTRETTAATVRVEPAGDRAFRATVDTGDGASRTFDLAGDQVWIDARIVKWHPYANLVGLHTAYRLERIGGRYDNLDDERTAPRTVEALNDENPAIGVFDWAGGQRWLRPLVDAEYGSGSFTAADAPRTVQVRVSTTGLLIRDVTPSTD